MFVWLWYCFFWRRFIFLFVDNGFRFAWGWCWDCGERPDWSIFSGMYSVISLSGWWPRKLKFEDKVELFLKKNYFVAVAKSIWHYANGCLISAEQRFWKWFRKWELVYAQWIKLKSVLNGFMMVGIKFNVFVCLTGINVLVNCIFSCTVFSDASFICSFFLFLFFVFAGSVWWNIGERCIQDCGSITHLLKFPLFLTLLIFCSSL